MRKLYHFSTGPGHKGYIRTLCPDPIASTKCQEPGQSSLTGKRVDHVISKQSRLTVAISRQLNAYRGFAERSALAESWGAEGEEKIAHLKPSTKQVLNAQLEAFRRATYPGVGYIRQKREPVGMRARSRPIRRKVPCSPCGRCSTKHGACPPMPALDIRRQVGA